jgi:hypothetical protein
MKNIFPKELPITKSKIAREMLLREEEKAEKYLVTPISLIQKDFSKWYTSDNPKKLEDIRVDLELLTPGTRKALNKKHIAVIKKSK